MADLVLFPKNTSRIELNGLLDADLTESSGLPSYVNDAIVTAYVADVNGDVVPNSSITLNYVGGSNGNYHGTLSSAFDPRPGGYAVVIDVTASAGVSHLEVPTDVQVRTS